MSTVSNKQELENPPKYLSSGVRQHLGFSISYKANSTMGKVPVSHTSESLAFVTFQYSLTFSHFFH